MSGMNKRGVYFFVIDAMIAASIIFLSLMIIFSSRSVESETNPTLRMLEEYTDFLINTKVREFQGGYIQKLINDSNITDLDNTLLEQITEFYYFNESGLRNTTVIMWNFTEEISRGVISEHRSFLVYINNTMIYNRTKTSLSESPLALTSKKISFKRINETFIYGPIILEVKIWV